MSAPVIDFRSDLPTRDGVGAAYLDPPEHHSGYAATYQSAYDLREEDVVLPLPRFLNLLDEAGIDVVLVFARDARDTHGSHLSNEAVAAYAGSERRVRGLAAANPHRADESAEGIERAVAEYGFVGVNVSPWEQGLPADDRSYYPIYEKCVELGVPVVLHTGINFGARIPMELGRPLALDRVACDFPDLRIVAAHGGWPWVTEMVGVAWRHPNVYIEISGIRPRYLAQPGSGWEVLLQFGNSVLQDRILFGTDWPLQPFKRTVDEIRALPLKPAVMDKWLGLNAACLLRLDG